MDDEEFIEKAKEVHGNEYDYSLVDTQSLKVTIICPKHGEFQQNKYLHINGSKCPLCSGAKSYGLEWFIQKAHKIHGDKYNYSEVDYKGINTKVIIICPEHGRFLQKPNYHINHKSGCPKCGRVKCSGRYKTNDFILKARKIHGNKYDYSKTEYTYSYDKVVIICPKHGEFEQIARDHINNKAGCNKCAVEQNAKKLAIGESDFIKRSKIVHGDKYSYLKVDYKNSKTKVTITCPEHGEFRQTPSSHLQGYGCRACCSSIKQSEIFTFIQSLGVEIVENDRNLISPYELDLVSYDNKLAVEFHGMYYHSFNTLETTKEKIYHKEKCNKCEEKGFQLIQVFENEWDTKKDIIKSILKSKFGKNNVIYARKCEIVNMNSKEISNFMCTNHLQGNISCSMAWGLLYNGEIVCAMSFRKHPKYEFEIARFACKLGINVTGGANKLFNKFIKKCKPVTVLSYADRRYSNGKLYYSLGFCKDDVTCPNYKYLKKNEIFSRQMFQKHKLSKKLLKYDENLTEGENMFNNGYRRIWDAGNIRFLWHNK